MKYRKKPLIIDAVQFNKSTYEECKIFCTSLETFQHPRRNTIHGMIPTLEGMMEVQDGDWIIKGVKGEFYPCKRDIFLLTYEAI